MDKESKLSRLKRLEQEITSIPDSWLFPSVGKVQGFFGTGPIMFVGERPSTGKYGGPSDRHLYRLLEELGIENSHLTDVIKVRGKVEDPYPEEMGPHKRIFDKEIEIIQPRMIIAFGQKVYDLLQFSLAGTGIKIRQTYHYAYARWGAAKAVLIEKQLRQIVRNTVAHPMTKDEG
jgi:uracil-DNA glycosylase family 4